MKRICLALMLLPFVAIAANDFSDLWPDQSSIPHYDANQSAGQPNMMSTASYREGVRYMPFLDWYTAPTTAAPAAGRPCLILISGGAYSSIADMDKITTWRNKFTALGIQCVVLYYRVPRSADPLPIYQAAWDDGQRAVRLVRSQAATRGLDPTKIGVIGMSAGSHLATLLATSSLTPAYTAVDALDANSASINVALANAIAYGLSDGLTGPNSNRGIGATLDTIFKFDDQTCPMCMTHGGSDQYSPLSSSMVWRKLREKGVVAEIHTYPDKDHGAYGLDRHVEFLRKLGWIPSETAVAPATRWPDDSACAGVSNETYSAGTLAWYHPAVHKTASIQILLEGPAAASQEVADAIVSARRYLNATGITVVTAQIRSGSEVADARAAVAAVRADAAKYNLNADYIGLMGYRADAATAVAAATTTVADNKVRWVAAISPTTGVSDAQLASITSDTPPTLFIHEEDNATDSAIGSVASWEKQRELYDQGAVHTLADETADFISAAAAPGTAAYTYFDRVYDFLSEKKDLAAWTGEEEDPGTEEDPDPEEPVEPEPEYVQMPWFDVDFANAAFVAGSDWIAQSTDPAGGTFAAATGVESELVKPSGEAYVQYVTDAEGEIVYTPSAASPADKSAHVTGRAKVESRTSLPPVDANATAGLCFISGFPYGLANGTWTKIGVISFTEGEWVDYDVEFDFASASAPRVRYTVDASVGNWIALDGPASQIVRVRFEGGSFGDFAGTYAEEVVEPTEADPDTSWMAGSFGVSFHWTAKIVDAYGSKNWEQAVANFNVKNFADSVESFGAKHVIFTTAHAWQKLPCPCTALDSLISGRTTTRDLLKDIIDELTNRNVRVVFYYNHSCNHNEDQPWDEASGYDAITDAQSMTNFANNICSIVRELSLRYGDGVSAWWFDSASSVDDSQPWTGNKSANNVAGLTFPWDDLFAAARAGNPHAAVAVNWDVHQVDQHGLATDYLSGETEKIDAYGNFFPFAPEGFQDHIWTRMDSSDWFWTGNEVSTYGSRFSAEQLAWWKASHLAAGRMATLNLVIDEAGNINPVVAQQLVDAKTIGKVWVQGRYDPTTWQAAPSTSNLVLGLTAAHEGNRSQYTDGYHRTPTTVLTDGVVPMTAIVAGANLTNDEKAKIFESLQGNVFTWTLEEASDIYGLNIYSRSSRSQYNGATDGGNDAIVVTKVEVQRGGSTDWVDINAPTLSFGKSDGLSGGALAAKLVDKSGAPLATGVTAIRFTQGACENDASLLVEAEVLGCATPPPYELGWTAGPMSATGDTLDTRGDLVYAFCRQQSAGWNTSSLTVNDIGFTGIWYTQHENVKIGGESLTTYFEFSPDLNNCSEGLGDENVTGDYALFLKNGWWYSGSGNVTCTLKRLTAGKTYLVQFVTHWNSGTGRSFWPTDDTTKIAYTKSTDCAYGSYLTAVFTATNVTQTFEFARTGNEFVINGFQVRELAGGEEPVDPPVPEPPPVYALTIPAKAGLALDSVKTNSIPVEAVNSVYSIVSNTEVTVTFSAASGYELDGDDGVVVKTIVSDYSFVDSDYPAVKEQGGGEDPDDPPSGGDDVELGWTAGPMSATGDTIDTRGKLVYAFCQDGTSTGANMVTHEVNGVIYYGAYSIANTSNKLDGKNVSDYFTAQLTSTYGSCGDEGVTDVDCRQLLTNCFWDNKGEGTTFDLTLKQLEVGKTYLVQITTHWSNQSGKRMYAPGSDTVCLQFGGTGWTYGGYLTGIFTANGTEETFAIKCAGGTGMINSIQVREVTLGGGEDPEEPQPGELVNGRANMKGWAMKRVSTTAKGALETGFGWSVGDNPSSKSYTAAAEQCESVMTFTDAQVVNTIQLFAPKTENNAIPQVVNQMPSAFKIYGSNDDSAWTELLSVTGESDWLSMECRYYTFNNTTAYTQYKLAVESTVSGGAAKLGVYNYFLAVQPDPTTPWTFANGTLTRGDQQFTNVANDENKIYLRYSDNASNESLYDLDFTAGIVDGSGNPIDLPFKINGITGNKTITRVVGSPETLTFMGAEQGLQGIWYLNEVDFGTTLASAGIRTFKESYSLQHIHESDWTIPALLEETFTSCYNLSGDLVFHVLTNKAVFSGSRITSVSFPDITYFGNGNDWMAAFGLCPRLTNVVFGAGLETVNCGQFLGKIVGPTAVRWNSAPPTFLKGETSIFSDKADFTVTNYLPNDYETEWTAYAESKGSNFTLPDSDTPGTWTSGKKAYVMWWNGSSEEPEESVYTLTIPAKEGLTVASVTTNGEEVVGVDGVYSVYPNAEVTITFAAAGGYELTGSGTVVLTVEENTTLADGQFPGVREHVALYVSPTAVTGVGDGSYANPYTMDEAWSKVKAGETIQLLDGTYVEETVRGDNSIFTVGSKDNITFQGNIEHPENVVIDFNGATSRGFYSNGHPFAIRGITFQNKQTSGAPGVVYMTGTIDGTALVENCCFSNVTTTATSGDGRMGTILRCDATGDVVVRNCEIKDSNCYVWGPIYMTKGDLTLDHCSVTNCHTKTGNGAVVGLNGGTSLTLLDSDFRDVGCELGTGTTKDNSSGILHVNSGSSASVTVRRCRFWQDPDCGSRLGAFSAVAVATKWTFEACEFYDFKAGGGWAGLFYLSAAADLSLSDCVISNCCSTGSGGVIGVNASSAKVVLNDCTVSDCRITNTKAEDGNSGGLLYVAGDKSGIVFAMTNCVCSCEGGNSYNGGQMFIGTSGCSVSIDRCAFTGCAARNAGGVLFSRATSGEIIIRNTLFDGCAANNAGGTCIYTTGTSDVKIENCTFVGNTSTATGAKCAPLYQASANSPHAVKNCIFWNNKDNSGAGTSRVTYDTAKTTFENCVADVSGLTGVTQISASPFVDAENGDYTLAPLVGDVANPCIDAGVTLGWMTEALDLAGATRVFGSAPDLGVYEYGAIVPNFLMLSDATVVPDEESADLSVVLSALGNDPVTAEEAAYADITLAWGLAQDQLCAPVAVSNHAVKGDVCSKTISGLSAATTYYYEFAAVNDLGAVTNVTGSFTTLTPVYTLTIPTKEGLTLVSVETNGVAVVPAGGVYSVYSNAQVTVTFAAEDGYELTGSGAVVLTIDGNKTFGESDYPEFQLKPVLDYWVYDSTAKTLTWGANVISNVTVSGKNLTIGNNQANPLAVDLDFSKTIDGDYQLVQISGAAFKQNAAVTRFVAPGSLTTIQWDAFYSCSNLITVDLNEGLTTIGDGVFRGSANLTTIGHLPSTLTSCGGNAFNSCSSLTGDLVWPAETYNVTFVGSKITSIDLSSAKYITAGGQGPFKNCSLLTNVVIGAGVESISAATFLGDLGSGDIIHVWWHGVPTDVVSKIFQNSNNGRIVNHFDYAQKAEWEALAESLTDTYTIVLPATFDGQGSWTDIAANRTQTIEWFGELSNSASVTPAVMSASVEFFVSNIGDAESADILFASAESGNELPEASVLFTGVVTGESKTSSITDLEPGTTYDYKVIYRDHSSEETLWEKTGTFATLTPTAPAGDFVISTVTYRSIAFDATVTDFGVGSTDAVLKVEVSTTDDFATIAGSASVTVDETGTYPLTVSGLTSETVYYCRLVISNTWDLETVSPVRSQRTKVVFAEDKFAKKVDMTLAGYTGTSTITDLPVLVRLSEGTPSGFSYADCPASSIRFTDADGNMIPYEIDTWNPDGESLVWVKVPTVSGTDTAISMYYGGAGMKQDRLPESEVWSNYAAVWHLNESGDDGVTTPLIVENSSEFGSALDGEAYGGTTATNGCIGGARHIFSGTSGMGGIWAPGDLDCTRFGGQLTLSAWLIHDSGTVSWDHIFYKRATSGDNEKYGGLAIELNNGNLSADVRGGNNTSFSSGTIVSKTKWTYVSYVYDNTTCAVYSDGVLKKTGTVGAVTDNTQRWSFGNSTTGDHGKTGNSPWRGAMDEIRLSGVVQTADYAAAEYAAMTNGFLTLGAVEPTSGSVWTALVNEPGSVTLLGETAAELENGPFAFKFAYAVSGQPLGEWTTVADNFVAGTKLSQTASGFELGVTYDYALICVDKDGTELAREEGSFMPTPAMPEFSSGTVWISGLEQAKFSSQFDVTSEKSASVIDVQVVPGTVMAEVSATETTYSENGYTNPYTGRTYFFNKQNSTFAYYGWMWLEAGDTINFAKNFDDAGFVKIGDTEVLKNSTYNSYPVGSYTAETTGWYRVDLRVGDGSGGKGPGGGPVGKSIGLGYNINGTATQAAEGWSPIRDDGNDAMFLRTVDLSIHPMMMGVTEVVRTGDDVTLWAAFKDVPGAAELRAYCDSEDHGDSPSEWSGYVKVADIAAGDTELAKYTAVGAGPNQFIRFALVVLGTETVQGRYLFSDPYEFAQDRPVFDHDSLVVTPRPSMATVNIELDGLGVGATSAEVYFAYGTDAETLGEPVLVKADAVAGETLSVALADLTYETTYSFCFYATNDVNTEVGASFRGEFTTLPSEELAFRDAKILAGTKSAEASVVMKDIGEEADAVSAVVTLAWGEDADRLGKPVVIATAAEKDEKLTYVIDGLTENTQYYCVFTATNNLGAVTTLASSFKTPDPTIARSAHDFYPTNTTDNVLVPDGFAVTYFAEDVKSPYHVIPEDNCTFVYTSTVTTAGQEYKFFSEVDFEANATARIGETYYLFLSDAVDAAESGDTIELLKDNNFVAKQMKIAFPLVINGNGHTVKVKDPYVREDGVINTNCTTDVRNVFLIQNGGDVEMYDMTVMGGGREKNYNVGQLKNYADQSSAVAVNNGGVLKMENVTLTRSNGGLVTEHGSRVLIDKCQIVRNCRFCGGGMYTRGVVVMNDSSLSENRSTGYWDLSKNQWGGGGAAENQGEMYINNCVICNNVSGECGGAINNYSDTYDIKLYMINSTVAGNFTTKGEVNAGGISLRVGYTGGKSEFCAVNNIICNNYYYNTSAKTVTMSDIRVGAPKTSTDPVESFIAYNAIGDFKAGSYTNITTLSNITYVVPANVDVFLSYYSSARTYQWDETTECEISTGSLRSAPNDPNALYTPINPTGAAVVDSAGVTTYFDYSDWKSGSVKMSYAAADGELQEIGVLEMATADDLVTSFYETDIVPDTITREIGIMGADGWTTDEVNYYKLRLIEEPVNGEVANITMYGRDYPAGTEVTVLATPDFACEFVGWYEVDGDGNDVLVSPDAAYTVVMDRHIGLKAKFSEPTEPHVFLNIKCEQTEGDHGYFPLTMTTNWLAKAFPAIAPDGLVTAENEKALEDALNAPDEVNGLNHVWMNYVIGQLQPHDPDGRIWIRADQTRDKETLRFRMQELAPTKGCGFKVRYRLNKKPAGKETYSRGSYAESGSFEDKVTLSDLEHRVIDLIFIPTNSQTSAEYVTTVNTAGVIKVESSKKAEILASPWAGFAPFDNPAVKAPDYVKASCLTTNDVLYVYDRENANYVAWTVRADGTWKSVKTYLLANGGITDTTDATRTNAIPRGAGVWLERHDVTKPIYLYGQVDGSSVTTRLESGFNLIGSPLAAPFDLRMLPAPADKGVLGDHIAIPTGAEPINIYYVVGKGWAVQKSTVTVLNPGTDKEMRLVSTEWDTESESLTLPLGHGFWYYNKNSNARDLGWTPTAK